MLPGLGACALAGLLMLLFGRDHPAELGLPPTANRGGRRAAPAAPAGNAVAQRLPALADASGTASSGSCSPLS